MLKLQSALLFLTHIIYTCNIVIVIIYNDYKLTGHNFNFDNKFFDEFEVDES